MLHTLKIIFQVIPTPEKNRVAKVIAKIFTAKDATKLRKISVTAIETDIFLEN